MFHQSCVKQQFENSKSQYVLIIGIVSFAVAQIIYIISFGFEQRQVKYVVLQGFLKRCCLYLKMVTVTVTDSLSVTHSISLIVILNECITSPITSPHLFRRFTMKLTIHNQSIFVNHNRFIVTFYSVYHYHQRLKIRHKNHF